MAWGANCLGSYLIAVAASPTNRLRLARLTGLSHVQVRLGDVQLGDTMRAEPEEADHDQQRNTREA